MFKFAVLLSAIFIALCAGWFSITGIGQLFQGAQLAAILMAASLELGKLTTVSYLYRYWLSVNKLMRAYMLMGAVILSLITSVGIYGFLASAYSTSSVEFNIAKQNEEIVTSNISSIDDQITFTKERLGSLNQIQQQQENRLDSLVGRNGLRLQQQRGQQIESSIKDANDKLAQLYSTKDSLMKTRLSTQQQTTQNHKLAALDYFAKVLNVPLDNLVQWFILALVLVFDPLSVCLVVAYNSIAIKTKSKENDIVEKTSNEIIVEGKSNIPDEVVTKTDTVVPPEITSVEETITKSEEDDSIPYYRKHDYDWNNDKRWLTDSDARIYYQRLHG